MLNGGVDKRWARPWPTLWPTLWPTGGQIFLNKAQRALRQIFQRQDCLANTFFSAVLAAAVLIIINLLMKQGIEEWNVCRRVGHGVCKIIHIFILTSTR